MVSPDATALASWYADNHKPGWLCLNLLAAPCGSAAVLSDPRFPSELFLARTFNSLGFAARREEWCDLIEPVWFGGNEPLFAGGSVANWGTKGAGGWDWSIYALLAKRKDLFSVQPALARATHTGRAGAHLRLNFTTRLSSTLRFASRLSDRTAWSIRRSRSAGAFAGLCAGGNDGTSAEIGEKGQSDWECRSKIDGTAE